MDKAFSSVTPSVVIYRNLAATCHQAGRINKQHLSLYRNSSCRRLMNYEGGKWRGGSESGLSMVLGC